MRWRFLIWLLLSGTLGLVVWRWIGAERVARRAAETRANKTGARVAQSAPASSSQPGSTAPSRQADLQGRFAYRLTNTTRGFTELMRDPRAILLENALLDTRMSLELSFPRDLMTNGDPGCYIVQARHGLTDSFREALGRSGAIVVSYIPNDAYLVRISSEASTRLLDEPEVAAVLPYEPYYKVKPSLLQLVFTGISPATPQDQVTQGSSDPAGTAPKPDEFPIKVLLFRDAEQETLQQLKAAGLPISDLGTSPFGTTAQFSCSLRKVSWVARLPGVQELELAHTRVAANDLSRVTLGVASDSITPQNYLGLTGSNVLVNVNDSGVDTNHPDLKGRVIWDVPNSGFDTNGHGTHVAGIIAGNGSQSQTVTEAPGSVMPSAAQQFRGLAPGVTILSIAAAGNATPASDSYLQKSPASEAAFISNNSWHYSDDTDYDLGAASFDAAVRDSLPGVPGSQPVLFVFAAGNAGNGADDGTGGFPDTVQSPGTAKNVITVGALEQMRFITNQTWTCTSNGISVVCQTNTPWLPLTDSSNQVASFSSRGNVGVGTEGLSGRFKPDLVAPGTFIVSTRSTTWDQAAYYSGSSDFLNIARDANSAQVLSNLNNGLGPFYRFESGSSLAAAEVSGVLALMQEFFQTRFLRTNSPALMKALLINGARSLAQGYDLHSPGATNAQGWGVVRLPNSLPGSLTNSSTSGSSMWFYEQSPQEALATGQQRTRFVALTPDAQSLPLRVTLAWTDPPGNPVAGIKLVNDLDLIVTNLETGEVFWGNDIPANATFNSAQPPGSPANPDRVNNVENVYLSPDLGSNYAVTVQARRVGVNAVTEHPNGVVQDYVLVISSGDGQLTNALSLSDGAMTSILPAAVTVVTNQFVGGNPDSGMYLLHERVAGNAPLLATNSFALPGSTNGVITIGTPSQWHFYVFTNQTPFTNAVFLTFQAESLSLLPDGGDSLSSSSPGLLWTPSADLDLYVSVNPGLTNLDPAAVEAADKSLGRGGSEMITYSNATPGVYYIGVKCESLQGADYGFLADVSQQPFEQVDSVGNEILRGFPQTEAVPGGTTTQPGKGLTFFVSSDTIPLRRVIVTNTLSSSSLADLQVTLEQGPTGVVLNNHSARGSATAQTFIYDDSGEGDIQGALASDGPGTLRQFSGSNGGGQWLMTTLTTNGPATNQSSSLFLERQQDLGGAISANVLPGHCREDFLWVPMQTTNVTTMATLLSGTGPISLEVFPRSVPASNCVNILISGTGTSGVLTSDQFSQPPLNSGLYFVRTCNLGPDVAGVVIQANQTQAQVSPTPDTYTSSPQRLPIADDALTFSSLNVTNTDPIAAVSVGVRIEHQRISDLMLSLLSPDGTRVLLDAGRGNSSTNGLGANQVLTNTSPVSFSGGPDAVTNTFDTGETSGTISINYDFFALPDEMRVYYQNQLLYDSGLVSFGGSTNINYGPGTSTMFTVVMNQGGSSQSNTAWFYSVTSTRIAPMYLTFTEDTNLASLPIKFAPVPFTNLTTVSASPSGASGVYYLPEESLDSFSGKSPLGQWTLEILDTRAGATSPPPTLVSWQLNLWLASSHPTPVPLAPSVPWTNLLGAGQIQWYEVDVPDWASFATNTLLSSSGPVNLLFNSSVPPTGTNIGDLFLAFGSSARTQVLSTNTSPALVPGSSYFLGVQNTNASTITIAFLTDFDVENVITLASGVPYSNTNSGPFNGADFYRYVVSTNGVRVQFEINGPTSDMTLVAHKGPPLPNLATYDYISANPGTNDELIVVYDFSRPVPLSPGEWFLSAINVTGVPATYSILATEFTDYGTNIVVDEPIVSTNGICLTWSSLPGVHYFVQGKTDLTESNWTGLSSTLTAGDYTTTFCVPWPSPYAYFRVLGGIVLSPALPIISSLAYSTNGILLQWSAPTNVLFTIQWTPGIAPANWHFIPGLVTSTNGTFLFLDDGSQTGGLGTRRFYRLRQRQ